MQVDRFFRQLERRSERDLYRKTSRAVFNSQRNLLNKAKLDKKVLFSRRMATEFLWFFMALLIGFIFGYLVFTVLEMVVQESTFDSFVNFLGGEVSNLLYILIGVCFIGVYVTRGTIWAFSKL